jgi:hypothetical protein
LATGHQAVRLRALTGWVFLVPVPMDQKCIRAQQSMKQEESNTLIYSIITLVSYWRSNHQLLDEVQTGV